MTTHDFQETVETAVTKQRKAIGLTTAIVAVLLAVAGMLGNSANTQKIVIETKTADWWAYVHSSDTNARIYTANARLAELNRGGAAVEDFTKLASEQSRRGFPTTPAVPPRDWKIIPCFRRESVASAASPSYVCRYRLWCVPSLCSRTSCSSGGSRLSAP